MTKKLCMLFVLAAILVILPGCYDRREVDDLAYVTAIGLDKAKTNNVRLTLQFAVPTVIGGGEGGGGGGDGGGGNENKAVTIMTLEAPSVMSGLNLANNFINKQINLSHAKIIVFSKKLAQEGIDNFIYGMPRIRELRPNTIIMISRESAESFLNSVNPKLTLNPAKFYELISLAYTYTGFTANTQFHDFYVKSKSTFAQPVATLASVGKFEDSDDFNTEASTYREKGRPYPFEGDFKAGDIPNVSSQKSEIMGLAAFLGGRMVGELDGEETTYHLMVTGEYNTSVISIPDPLKKDETVILKVKKGRNPVWRVTISDNKPQIYVKIILEADILAIQSGINYEEKEKLPVLEQAYEKLIKDGLERYLNRTAREFRADLCGFGKEMKRKFLTWKEWENFDWMNKYKDSVFDIEVELKIRRPGLIVRSVPMNKPKGDEK